MISLNIVVLLGLWLGRDAMEEGKNATAPRAPVSLPAVVRPGVQVADAGRQRVRSPQPDADRRRQSAPGQEGASVGPMAEGASEPTTDWGATVEPVAGAEGSPGAEGDEVEPVVGRDEGEAVAGQGELGWDELGRRLPVMLDVVEQVAGPVAEGDEGTAADEPTEATVDEAAPEAGPATPLLAPDAGPPDEERVSGRDVPQGVACGAVTCGPGQVCCNESCSICTEPGQRCHQRTCGMPYGNASISCGSATCSVGEVCCNPSCGICVAPGQTCDQRTCLNPIQTLGPSESCGMSTCNVGEVCCNPSCGICTKPGEPCSREVCD